MIKADPDKSNGLMGADVKQSAAEFADSAKYLRWASKDDNKTFFGTEFQDFSKTAADLLVQMGLIKPAPDVSTLADTRFVNYRRGTRLSNVANDAGKGCGWERGRPRPYLETQRLSGRCGRSRPALPADCANVSNLVVPRALVSPIGS